MRAHFIEWMGAGLMAAATLIIAVIASVVFVLLRFPSQSTLFAARR